MTVRNDDEGLSCPPLNASTQTPAAAAACSRQWRVMPYSSCRSRSWPTVVRARRAVFHSGDLQYQGTNRAI